MRPTGIIRLDLDNRSFGNAARITDAINARMGRSPAPDGPGQIVVRGPPEEASRVRFLADLLDISLNPEPAIAEVVIDAQSGTVVMGQDVSIGPAAVAYGSLAVTVNETPQVSQPGSVQPGHAPKGCRAPRSRRRKNRSRSIELQNAPKVSDIVRNLNAIGATSSDLIAILQALKQSGSLHARIKVI